MRWALSIPGELILRAGVWLDPGITPCVKTHTSAKCRKHNCPARHRTSRVQYDLTLRDAIGQRYFYVRRERWSFRTAKTRSGHASPFFVAMHVSAARADERSQALLPDVPAECQ